jgi:hypothetical protein
MLHNLAVGALEIGAEESVIGRVVSILQDILKILLIERKLNTRD